jgi:hypothetical protein
MMAIASHRSGRDSDGTATAAINEDLSVPKDCQARAESIARRRHPQRHRPRRADPNTDVDKLERLLAMQERVLEREAERAFNAR